jgi:hypothetical protein
LAVAIALMIFLAYRHGLRGWSIALGAGRPPDGDAARAEVKNGTPPVFSRLSVSGMQLDAQIGHEAGSRDEQESREISD